MNSRKLLNIFWICKYSIFENVGKVTINLILTSIIVVAVDRILKRPKLILDGATLSVRVVESSCQKEKHLKGKTLKYNSSNMWYFFRV